MSQSLLQQLNERWSDARSAERANAQSYLIELCNALGVEPPRPAGSGYEFEFAIRIVNRDGTDAINFLDLYKAGHFALEAKDNSERPSDLLLRKAFGQVRSYVGHLPHERPPFLLVLDVGRTLIVWDRWNGDYGGFSAGRRIDLRRLSRMPEDIEFLRDIWTDPTSRDPRSVAVLVTKEIASHLADLAIELEAQGYEHERVARFIIRCVFTMFAEDTGLLAGEPFRRILDEVAMADPAEFVPLAEGLWRAMDGGERFLLKKLLRFNGHFFRDAEALPLERKSLNLLLIASQADWQHVEPTIFGTLLTRALDPVKRHRLGAEYTPREFVERVVRPTVEQPLRERWTAVQAEVLQLRESGKPRNAIAAEKRLREFHEWLRGLRFLDPACGSGNFLYVTMHLVKRIELEVIRAIADNSGEIEIRLAEVGPWQFHGIEVDAWPREIAELTLWIGFHQFWQEHHDVQPPEPILQDTGTLELRDAVLKWDRIEEDPGRAYPNSEPIIRHPVSGVFVPDPDATLPYEVYRGARAAEWPLADFIIGNPPYIGASRQKEAFGNGYVDALRAAYPDVPDSVDYVMYWWHKAANAVAMGQAMRAGLITTNTITQTQNRVLIEHAAMKGAHVMWAVPDHPWIDEAGAADVRVAMTVIARDPAQATRVDVNRRGEIIGETVVERLNADLTTHADVATATSLPLRSNMGLATRGFMLFGKGFVVKEDEALELLDGRPDRLRVLKPLRNGRDLTNRPRRVYVIDFALREDSEAKEYPVLYDIIRTRVKPERDRNKREVRRRYWWRFGEPNQQFREAATDLQRYIATPETAKHRFFVFLDARVAPDNKLVCIASQSAFHMGVLSSRFHGVWALSAGGRLGVGNDPVYVKSK